MLFYFKYFSQQLFFQKLVIAIFNQKTNYTYEH